MGSALFSWKVGLSAEGIWESDFNQPLSLNNASIPIEEVDEAGETLDRYACYKPRREDS